MVSCLHRAILPISQTAANILNILLPPFLLLLRLQLLLLLLPCHAQKDGMDSLKLDDISDEFWIPQGFLVDELVETIRGT